MRNSFILETIRWVLLLALAIIPAGVEAFDSVHHQLQIELDPSSHFAQIEDRIKFKNFQEACEPLYLEASPHAPLFSTGSTPPTFIF